MVNNPGIFKAETMISLCNVYPDQLSRIPLPGYPHMFAHLALQGLSCLASIAYITPCTVRLIREQ